MRAFTNLKSAAQRLTIGVMAMGVTHKAYAQLSEAENLALWIEDIFSPGLMLSALIILIIGVGLAIWFGRMSGGLFVKILVGALLVFGARTIAPKIITAVA